MTNLSTRLPWDFDPELDSGKSYEAFVIYRNLGRIRSLDSVAQTLGKQRSLIYRWSVGGKWASRALEYDLELEKAERDINEHQRLIEHKSKLERYRQQIESLGWTQLELAARCVQVCNEALEKYGVEKRDLKPIEVRAIASAGASAAEIGTKLLSDGLGLVQIIDSLDELLELDQGDTKGSDSGVIDVTPDDV